jgi:hypothetical protein
MTTNFTEDNRLQVATGDGYPKYLVYFMQFEECDPAPFNFRERLRRSHTKLENEPNTNVTRTQSSIHPYR